MTFRMRATLSWISLSEVCGIFESLLSGRELKTAGQRIDQVRKMDLIGREVSKAVRDIELALASVRQHQSSWGI